MVPHWTELEGKTFLICIGAAKCGTSWLYTYLNGLPDAAVSPLKEMHFFDAKFPEHALGDIYGLTMARLGFHLNQEGAAVSNLRARPSFQASVDAAQMLYDDTAYFRHFGRMCTPETRAFADLTPSYSAIGPAGFEFMRDFCAENGVKHKILFLMRDPVDRLWSQMRHVQQMNPANDALENWSRALTIPALTARADYKGIVTALDATFPPGDVMYLFYEDLFARPAVQQLCDFVGVSFVDPVDQTAIRQNETTLKLRLPDPARVAFQKLLAPQYAFCRDRFGTDVPVTWQD